MNRSNPDPEGSEKDVKIAKTQAVEVQSAKLETEVQSYQHKVIKTPIAISVSWLCWFCIYLHIIIIFHQPILNKRRLVFVRHGEYDIASGSQTEMGRAKINRVGKLLRKHYPSVSAIYHSCITRSKESASIIVEKYSGVRMCPSKLLNEFQVDKNYQLRVSSHILCQPQRCM